MDPEPGGGALFKARPLPSKECGTQGNAVGPAPPGFPTSLSWSKSVPSLPSRTPRTAPASRGILMVFPGSWSSQKSEAVLVFCKHEGCPSSLGNQRLGIVSGGKQNKTNYFRNNCLRLALLCFGVFLSFSRTPRVGEGIQILLFILLKKETFSCSCSLEKEPDFFH